MDKPPLPPKKEVFLALLQGPSVFIHLDPRKDNVTVPNWFKKQFQLVLQVGLNMAVKITDLEVSDDGVSCTLSFNRSPFWCDVPWSAVYALVGEEGRGMVWQDSVPSELATHNQRPNLKAVPKQKAKKERLAVVRPIGGAGEEDGSEASVEAVADQDRRTLAAVPEPAESSDEKQEAESTDDDKPTDPDGNDSGSKRDLPPYLRVIK